MKDKEPSRNQAIKDIGAPKEGNKRPDAKSLTALHSKEAAEGTKEVVDRDVLNILKRAYEERIEDSRNKRRFRTWVIPWSLFCGTSPLILLLASVYFHWPTEIDPKEPGLYTALILASSLILVSIYGLVLISLKGNVGTSTDEMGVLRALIHRFFW